MSSIVRALALVVATSAMLWGSAAWAQDAGARVAFVSLDRLMREAAPAKAAQTRLEQEFSKRERDIGDAENALKNASERFERESLTMSESQRQTRQRQLVDQDRDLQRKRREFQEDLNARKQEELQQVLERANRVVRQIAEAEKYDAIFQDAVYVNPRLDITDKVIKAMNNSK